MMRDIRDCRFGMFIHYVPKLTVDRQGKTLLDVNAAANAFDAEGFAEDVAAMGAEYIIFTAWHANGTPLFPSATMLRWRPQYFCSRDLIGELLDACEKRGILVMLYTHPRDGHDFPPDDRIETGWGAGRDPADPANPDFTRFDFARWNDFNLSLYTETVERYGNRLAGLWLDEGSAAGDSYRVVDYPRLASTLKSLCPDLLLMNNFYGCGYGLDLGMKEYFTNWGAFCDRSGESWPVYEKPVGAVVGQDWTATLPAGRPAMTYGMEALFRYTILQAGANRLGGGVAWAAGPYAGPHADGLWEDGVFEALSGVGRMLRAVGEGVFGTQPSDAFPTRSGESFATVRYGTATVSSDHACEYIHLLKDPGGRTVELGLAVNGARFTGATLLDGAEVALCQTEEGVTLTLPCDWQGPDLVVRLAVQPGSYGKPEAAYVNDTDVSVSYTGSWHRDWHMRVCGDFEGDVHLAEENGAACELLFKGGRVQLLCPQWPGGGRAAVYLDGVFYGQLSLSADRYQRQQTVFDSGRLYSAWHRLRVVCMEGTTAIDAFRVFDREETHKNT